MAFILSGKLITEAFNIYSELVSNHIARSWIVVLGVMSCAGIGSAVRQLLIKAEPLRNESPVFIEAFEFSDEIGEHISIGIDKPIQLIPMRRRVNAGGAAILNPINKLFEGHLVSEL